MMGVLLNKTDQLGKRVDDLEDIQPSMSASRVGSRASHHSRHTESSISTRRDSVIEPPVPSSVPAARLRALPSQDVRNYIPRNFGGLGPTDSGETRHANFNHSQTPFQPLGNIPIPSQGIYAVPTQGRQTMQPPTATAQQGASGAPGGGDSGDSSDGSGGGNHHNRGRNFVPDDRRNRHD